MLFLVLALELQSESIDSGFLWLKPDLEHICVCSQFCSRTTRSTNVSPLSELFGGFRPTSKRSGRVTMVFEKGWTCSSNRFLLQELEGSNHWQSETWTKTADFLLSSHQKWLHAAYPNLSKGVLICARRVAHVEKMA